MRNRPVKEDPYADPYESLLASVNKIRISSPPHSEAYTSLSRRQASSPKGTGLRPSPLGSKSVTSKRRQNPSDITDRLFDFAKNIEHHTKHNPLKSGYVSYQSARTQSKRHKKSNSPVQMSAPMSVPMSVPMSRSNSLRYHGTSLYTKHMKNSPIKGVLLRKRIVLHAKRRSAKRI
jgi:hypothetical protein